MTPQARQAISDTIDKLRDLGEKGRGSEYFEGFGDYDYCPLCAHHTNSDGGCPVFLGCRGPHSIFYNCPCLDYSPPGHRIIFERIVYFTENADPMSIRTFKRWCLSAATDLEQRFLGGE